MLFRSVSQSRYGGMSTSATAPAVEKSAVKVLGYWDIFKNFYANKQEENFYMIGSNAPLSVKINNVAVTDPYNIPLNIGTIKKSGTIAIADPLKIYNTSNVTLWVTQRIGHNPVITFSYVSFGFTSEDNSFNTAFLNASTLP